METKKKREYQKTTDSTNAMCRERMKKIKTGQVEDTRCLSFVEQICRNKGMTMKEFGARAGISEQMMSWYFKVKDNCRLSVLKNLFGANGMDIVPGVEIHREGEVKTIAPKVTMIINHTPRPISKTAPAWFMETKDENHPLHILWQIYEKCAAKTYTEFWKQIRITNDAGEPIRNTRPALNYTVQKNDIDIKMLTEIAQSVNLILTWTITEN